MFPPKTSPTQHMKNLVPPPQVYKTQRLICTTCQSNNETYNLYSSLTDILTNWVMYTGQPWHCINTVHCNIFYCSCFKTIPFVFFQKTFLCPRFFCFPPTGISSNFSSCPKTPPPRQTDRSVPPPQAIFQKLGFPPKIFWGGRTLCVPCSARIGPTSVKKVDFIYFYIFLYISLIIFSEFTENDLVSIWGTAQGALDFTRDRNVTFFM